MRNWQAIFVAILVGLTVGFTVLAGIKYFRRPAPVGPTTVSATKTWETQSNNAANVEVEVTPLELGVGQAAKFEVAFNTHSVPLGFNVASISTLWDEKGVKYSEASWEGTAAGGHHRRGALTFSQPLANRGKVRLVISGVAGVAEREFEWEVE